VPKVCQFEATQKKGDGVTDKRKCRMPAKKNTDDSIRDAKEDFKGGALFLYISLIERREEKAKHALKRNW